MSLFAWEWNNGIVATGEPTPRRELWNIGFQKILAILILSLILPVKRVNVVGAVFPF